MSRLILVPLSFLLFLVGAKTASGYEDLGLLPEAPSMDTGLLDLDMRARLARIDSLEASWSSLTEAERSEHHESIVHLYASSPLIKHRVWAQEDVVEPQGVSEASLRALLAAGWARERCRNPTAAMRVYESAVSMYPDSAAAHRALGRVLFELYRRRLHHGYRDRGIAAWKRAVSCPDASAEDWLGRASMLLATGRHVELRECVPHLAGLEGHELAVLLYEAAAKEALGLSNEAELLFRRATDQMSPSARALFLYGEEIFRDRGLDFAQPIFTDLSPPPALGAWWIRLLEIELLFGEPERGYHGWESSPGRVYLRYGRPDDAEYYHYQPEPEVILSRWRVSGYQRSLNQELGSFSTRDVPLTAWWVWIYEFGEADLPVVFEQENILLPWLTTVLSQRRVDKLASTVPFTMDPLERDPRIQLDLRHAAYPSGPDHVRAEAYFAVTRTDPDDERLEDYALTMTLLDAEGAVLETTERELGPQFRRQRLMETAVGRSETAADRTETAVGRNTPDRAVVGHLGLALSPGEYILRLEVIDRATGAYEAQDRRFELKLDRRALKLSDVELCDAFVPYRRSMDIPSQFVKHAQVVIPHPERTVPETQRDLYLYYEVQGAELDERGQAHLDVLYEVFNARGFHPFDAGMLEGSSHKTAQVRTLFPDERTGVSATGVVVKGTGLDISRLEPGDYVIAVTVSDRLGHAEAQRFVRFTRTGEGR